jgi:hypothetical protein
MGRAFPMLPPACHCSSSFLRQDPWIWVGVPIETLVWRLDVVAWFWSKVERGLWNIGVGGKGNEVDRNKEAQLLV